jgi:hypothetical protein
VHSLKGKLKLYNEKQNVLKTAAEALGAKEEVSFWSLNEKISLLCFK